MNGPTLRMLAALSVADRQVAEVLTYVIAKPVMKGSVIYHPLVRAPDVERRRRKTVDGAPRRPGRITRF